MKIFLDTADFDTIETLAQTGLVDGVTTNPSLVAKMNRPFEEILKSITAIIGGPVSAEVVAEEACDMIQQGKSFAKIASNIVVKLPLTMEGLKACQALGQENIQTNVTLCFSATQALMAAKAGATYVSPFMGRIDDMASDSFRLMEEIVDIFSVYEFKTQILAASIRHLNHVVGVARLGVGAMTVPPHIFSQLFAHPLTDKGLEQFNHDWEKTQVKA